MLRRLIPLLLCLWAPVAAAEESAGVAQTAEPEADAPVPWRGSAVVYRNSMSAISLDEGAELTYDPVYQMTWIVQPRWYFTDHIYARGSASLSHELTESNWTTDADETVWGDAALAVGSTSLFADPWLGLGFSAELAARFPTSKASQAQTLVMGADASVGVRRGFDLPVKITVGYGLKLGRDFHRFTTAEREAPLIAGCSGAECARHVNVGVRNARTKMSHTLSLGLGFTDWLSLGAGAGVHTQWLYPGADPDERVNLQTQAPTDSRHFLSGEVGLTVGPFAGVSLGLGAATFNPQQKPDSSDRLFFFNRYTQLYFDLSLDVAELTRATMSEG
jgi:hypothetical protein